MMKRAVVLLAILSLFIPSVASALNLFWGAKISSGTKIGKVNLFTNVKPGVYRQAVKEVQNYLCDGAQRCRDEAEIVLGRCSLLHNEFNNRDIDNRNISRAMGSLLADLPDETEVSLAKKTAWSCTAERSYLSALGIAMDDLSMTLAEIKALAMEYAMSGMAGVMGNTPMPQSGWSNCDNVGSRASVFGECGIANVGGPTGPVPSVGGAGQGGDSVGSNTPFGVLPGCLDTDPTSLFGKDKDGDDAGGTDKDTDDDDDDDDNNKPKEPEPVPPPEQEQSQQSTPTPQPAQSGGGDAGQSGSGGADGESAGTAIAKIFTSTLADAVADIFPAARAVADFINSHEAYIKPDSPPDVEGETAKGAMIVVGGTFMPNPVDDRGFGGCKEAVSKSFKDCIFGENQGSGLDGGPGVNGGPRMNSEFGGNRNRGFGSSSGPMGQMECRMQGVANPPRNGRGGGSPLARQGRGSGERPNPSDNMSPPTCHCNARPGFGSRIGGGGGGGCCPAHCFAARGGAGCSGCSMSAGCQELGGDGEGGFDINEHCSSMGERGGGISPLLDDICNDVNPTRGSIKRKIRLSERHLGNSRPQFDLRTQIQTYDVRTQTIRTQGIRTQNIRTKGISPAIDIGSAFDNEDHEVDIWYLQ